MGKIWKKKQTTLSQTSGCGCAPTQVPAQEPIVNKQPAPVPIAPGPALVPLAPGPISAPISEVSTSNISSPFLEQILETMKSLKETQERQGKKLEELMLTQNGKTSAEDVLKKILVAAKMC